MSRNVMQDALERAAERNAAAQGHSAPDAPAVRRPSPMVNPPPVIHPALLAIAGLLALAALVLLLRPEPRPLGQTAPAATYEALGQERAPIATEVPPPPAASPAEAPAPAEAYLEGQSLDAWQAQQPAPLAPQAPPVVVEPTPASLVPLEAEGWHPPFASGYDPAATQQNYVEVRP